MNNFIEDNVVEDLVVSDEPEQEQSQRLVVYVPTVKPGEKGIAEFDPKQFLVNDGKVSLKTSLGGDTKYAGTCTFGLDDFSYDDFAWREKVVKSSEKFLDKNGKYLVFCDMSSQDYTGDYEYVQGTTATVVDCSTADYIEIVLPYKVNFRDDTNDGSSWEHDLKVLTFGMTITDDYDDIQCHYIYQLGPNAEFDCTLTFIKIG